MSYTVINLLYGISKKQVGDISLLSLRRDLQSVYQHGVCSLFMDADAIVKPRGKLKPTSNWITKLYWTCATNPKPTQQRTNNRQCRSPTPILKRTKCFKMLGEKGKLRSKPDNPPRRNRGARKRASPFVRSSSMRSRRWRWWHSGSSHQYRWRHVDRCPQLPAFLQRYLQRLSNRLGSNCRIS